MSITLSMTHNDIVAAALRKLAVLGDGQAPSATQLTTGIQALDVMLHAFSVKGMSIVFVGDNLDFPEYWMEAVIYGLAHRLSPEYGIPLQDRQTLAAEAKRFLDDALEYSPEDTSLFFQPDWTTIY
jgi:succinyl-CoA synthetase beta subunit